MWNYFGNVFRYGSKLNWINVFSKRFYAPLIQRPAPYFSGMAVINGQFKEINLKDYTGKYLIFYFYPLDFTYVCPTEIIAFSDRIREFEEIGVSIVGCSTDSHFSHLAWINTDRKVIKFNSIV